jgi:hypothetical protein
MIDPNEMTLEEIIEVECIKQDWKLGLLSDKKVEELGLLENFHKENLANKLSRHSGSGPCPSCGSKTVLKRGRYGRFYGCINFPKCRGSRNV